MSLFEPMVRFQRLAERSVMPVESVIFIGCWAPATPPAATIVGFPTIVTTSCVFAPLGPVCSTQVAFVLHMRSATVSVFPPEHGGCVEVELFASVLDQVRPSGAAAEAPHASRVVPLRRNLPRVPASWGAIAAAFAYTPRMERSGRTSRF